VLVIASAKVCLFARDILAFCWGVWDSFGDNLFVAGFGFSMRFLLESLILAQDERWRRA
jgi:hypothetical protein